MRVRLDDAFVLLLYNIFSSNPYACSDFYRNVMSLVPGVCALVVLMLVVIVSLEQLGQRARRATSISSSKLNIKYRLLKLAIFSNNRRTSLLVYKTLP